MTKGAITAKEDKVVANIVDMDEDMKEKKESVTKNTPTTLTTKKEVGIHKQ